MLVGYASIAIECLQWQEGWKFAEIGYIFLVNDIRPKVRFITFSPLDC